MDTDNFIWYEKYRPTTLKEMVLPKDNKQKFRAYIEAQDLPHLLFFGPAGSGKTTLANILMDNIPCQRLVLNASSADRGIGTIKDTVKKFAASQPPKGKKKIVFFDEADNLTPDAQNALKNTIETYSKTCRFIFTANNVDRIIREIQSRPLKFKFDKFPKKKLIVYLKRILDTEKVKYEESDVESVVKKLYPDIRSIVNSLQSMCGNGKLDIRSGQLVSMSPLVLKKLVEAGNIRSIRKELAGTTDFVWLYKYLFDSFLFEIKKEQADVALCIAEYLYKDNTVADREINFTACLIEIMAILGIKMGFDK